MPNSAFSILFCALSLSSLAAWGAPKLSEGRQLAEQGKIDQLGDGFSSAKDKDEKDLWAYLQLYSLVQTGDAQKAVAKADEILSGKTLLEEEVRSLRAEALEKLKRPNDAIAEDRKLLEMSPNFKLKFEANLRTGRIRLAEGKYREARNIFAALEKKARSTPAHAEVVIELIRAERHLNSAAVCKWVRRLYAKDPLYPAVKDWGPVLTVNELDGERTGCASSNDDFKSRIRALMWAGEEDKARKEVGDLAQAVAHTDRYEADEIRSWFLLQDGQPDEAFQILQDLYPARKNKIGFLMIYASAAARSGQGGPAVGAYHRVYELSGRSSEARKALYQSAYLSYQFRDYDGAGRRFKEFIKKYPKSGLRRDSEWNLAWISYLRGDYDGALKQFKPFVGRTASLVRERTRYWMAMCHWRMGQFDKAKNLLTSLANDRSGSYYTAAARQRLTHLPAAIPVADTAKSVGPIRWGGMFQPAPDEMISSTGSEETESEETLSTAVADEATDDKDDNEKEEVADSGSSDILNDVAPLKAPANAKRFERAKALLKIGFADDARWELFEIERRTSGRDELKTLLTIYEEAGQFHRSSAIAQLRFGGTRIAQGYEGARSLWEAAYPRAYVSDVKAGVKETQLPEEFIWGIMKTESQFKRDAISPVGAVGLMQIMPGTGRRIAALRKDNEFAPAQLLQSSTAVRYGASYLKHLSKFFDGSIPLMAAGYNAGPHRVHGWLLSFGSLDMDEFIEHIPFLETREYVRRVVANALVYSSLYGGKRDLVDLASPITVKGRVEWSRKEIWE